MTGRFFPGVALGAFGAFGAFADLVAIVGFVAFVALVALAESDGVAFLEVLVATVGSFRG